MASWQDYLNDHHDQHLAELQEFVRIPSISSLPEHAGDVQTAAEWVARRMQRAGIENVQIMPTGGHPVVYGDWLHTPGQPTVLVYGHFDVQPVDPVHLWTDDPFSATIRDGKLYGRGASDSKGGMFPTILAVEAMLRTTETLPVNLKFLYEGQEEIGSPQLMAFVAGQKARLACDLVLNSDGMQWSETEPALFIGLRGGCALQIDVENAASDLHSGMYGGAIANPLHALTELVASMHAPDGTITVEGFYDDVRPVTPDVRERIAAVPFDESAYKAQIGVAQTFGEPGYSTHERLWVRPTLEIVGLWGGFQGEGIKTVLPREAHAKISCRLVADQDPARILDLLERHIERHTPQGVKVTVRRLPFHAYPYLMPVDHPANATAREVLVELYGREPYYVQAGGSVPVTDIFLRHLGAYSVSFAFLLPDENFHAPNEFFRLSSFAKAPGATCRFLERLSQTALDR